MRNLRPIINTPRKLAILFLLAGAGLLQAQSFPIGNLPAGKTIVITYEVDVNANACPNGTVPGGNISNQSQVQGSNFATVNTHETNPGAPDPTLTPFGSLTIGDLVYKDVNKDGDYDMGTDLPIDGVQLRLYLDDGDGVLTVGDGAHIASATTAGGGLYSFAVCPGNYIVEVIPANFNSGNPLYDNTLMAALVSSPIGGAPDPDNDVNDDDNGDPVSGFGVASAAITVAYGAEPDGADMNTNNRLDFGFKAPTTVTIGNVTLAEGTGGGPTAFNFTVTRSDDDEAFSLTVNTAGGTATSGTDFTAISGGTVSFAANDNNTTATVTVHVSHDNIVENNETFTVNLSGAPAGVVITDGTGDGTINNDDTATITLTGGTTVNETNSGSFTVEFVATVDKAVQGGFSAFVTTANGTAISPGDYNGGDVNLMFDGFAGEARGILISINGDNTVELNETFNLQFGSLLNPNTIQIVAPSAVQTAAIMTAGSPQTVTITNDDAATVSIAANVSQAENLTPQVFSVTLSNPVDVPVSVLFNTSDGTATTGDNDYNGIVDQSVTFPANTTTNQTVNVTVSNDNKVEDNENFNVGIGTLSAGGRNVSLGTNSRTGTINNDDTATITLSGGTTVSETNSGSFNVLFTAIVDNPVQGGFSAYVTTADGSASGLSDYNGGNVNLMFNGDAGQSIGIFVVVNGDLEIENNETFNFQFGTLLNPNTIEIVAPTPVQTAAIMTAGSPQTVTILNDEKDWGDAPTAAQSGFPNSYPTTAAQSGANHALAPGGLHLGPTVDADLDGQPNAGATGDGTDEDGVTMPSALALNTTANITVNASGTGKLNAWVDWNRNGVWESPSEQVLTDQTVSAGNNALSFSVPAGASTGNTYARFRLTTATGTAATGAAADGEVEDYQVNVVNNAYSISSPTVTEGDAPNTVVLNYVISRLDNTNAGSVDYSAPTGTATAGTDYVTIPAGTINFTAGGNMSETVSVTVNGDAIVEDNETVVITLNNPVNGGIGTGTGTGIINNDDTATITLTGGTTVNETNSGSFTVEFVATVDKEVQGGFSAFVTTANGTAISPGDYNGGDVNLMFDGFAGEARGILISINGDNTVELNETFNFQFGSLLNPNTIQIVAPSAVQTAAIMTAGSPQTVTITNDDAATVSIAANVSQAENLTPQVFTVTLSNPVDVPVSVLFNTSDGTAMTGDNDYTGIVDQSVTFPANTTTNQTVNVTVNNDNKVEANEDYTASIGTLSAGGRNVSLGTSSRTGTINNDDSAVVTLSGGGMANEGNTGTTPRVFTATLNNPVQGGFTVPYTTNDGLATTANNDYQDNDGTLTFAGTTGEAQTITVLVNGDFIVEANEDFTVALGAISGAPAGVSVAGSPQQALIVNDEIDFGDAPDSYGTLLASNGARHLTSLIVKLGTSVDGDPDGQPGALADGDDTDAEGDDDDGVTLPSALVLNTTANISISASIAGHVNGWVDFDQNGSFDPGDLIFNQQPVAAGANALSFAVPAGATVGTSYARFRFTQGAVAAVPTGQQTTGEVEDYVVNIVNTQFSIDDPSVAEGDSPGTSTLTFNISRTVNANACSVDYAITGGTATSGTDYQVFASGTANFTAGGAFSQPITVTVNGDNTVELNETVVMTLSMPVNASILDGSGTGTITNDDQGVITISNPSVTEGNAGTISATFDINLSNPSDANVTLNYATQDGTATLADNDYQNTNGSHTFLPGQTMKQVTVSVNGDCAIEPNEEFALRLGGLGANGRDVILSGGNPTLDGTGTINNDDALPEITCPTNAEYDTDPDACSALITLPLPTLGSICGSSTLEWRGRPVDGFNAPLQPYSAYAPAANNTAAFNKGRFEIEWKVTDGSGTSTCSYFIEIVDNQLPSISCPAPVTVTCSSNVPPVSLAAVTATDNCPGVVKSHVNDVTTNMTCANRKTITRTYRATDASGNSTTCAQVITVFDNVMPTFTFVPANVTVQCNSIPAVGSPSASDGCGGSVSIVYNGQTVSSILCTDKYTLTRQWTATDACGNTKTATQRIVVTDTQKPNFTSTPANITVQCTAIPDPAAPSATDNCDTDVAITYIGQTTTSGACPNAYTITRRWVASDNCNNTRSVSQRITVVDNGKPVFTAFPANTTIACDETPPAVGSPTASDGCGSATVTYLGQSTTSGSCPGNYQIRRTWRATDACGNSTVATQTIQVSDTGVPVFTSVPGPVTIECNQPLPPLVNPTASDACGGYVQITFLGNVPSGSGCAADYTVTRTWRAEDFCGNSATASQVITVLGNNNYEEEGAENRAEGATELIAHRSSLLVNPNPTTDRFRLDITDFAGESVTVSVVSDLGQLVWERRIPAVEDLQLSVSLREAGAAAGIYTVSVRSTSGVATTRVVLVE